MMRRSASFLVSSRDRVMEVVVNGEQRSFDDRDSLTVADLLERLEIEQTDGLAVAVDARVVNRSRWNEEEIEADAEVEIIRATQGG
jgi:sulfur carrier protein